MIADVDAEAWSRDRHVVSAPEPYSIVAGGVFLGGLKIPVTMDRVACLARHQFFAPGKYAAAFASPEVEAAFASEATLTGGVAFTGIANHWHFLIDGLGCLREVPRAFAGTLIVDADFSDAQVAFARRFAAAAGMGSFPQVQRVSQGPHRFRNVLFPTRRRFSDKVQWVRSVLGIEAPVAAPGRRLFVLRGRAASRRLLNEDAVASMLAARFGFEAIDPGALSIDEQLHAFRDASVIVGPHGAALANVVFAARPTLLVEIFHSEPQIFYHSLCHALGARHYAVRGAPTSASSDASRPDNSDFVVDERALGEVLSSILAPA